MKAARKLRVVRDCPQPEPAPYRPMQYGWIGGHKAERLTASPLPHEANVIARVQSMRTRNGARAEPLSYEDSIAYLRDAERKHRVTVPQPLCQPAPQQRTTPPPVAVARAGSFPIDKHDLPDMTPEQWEEWERAFGPEPNIPEER